MIGVNGTSIHMWAESQDTWFTIPKNATVEIKLYNVTKPDGATLTANLRESTGSSVFGSSAETLEDGSIVRSTTTIVQHNVGKLVISLSGAAAGSTFEFDVELLVNGEKWI